MMLTIGMCKRSVYKQDTLQVRRHQGQATLQCTCVLYFGCRLMCTSSSSPCANWHFAPYLQAPHSVHERQSSLCKRRCRYQDNHFVTVGRRKECGVCLQVASLQTFTLEHLYRGAPQLHQVTQRANLGADMLAEITRDMNAACLMFFTPQRNDSSPCTEETLRMASCC